MELKAEKVKDAPKPHSKQLKVLTTLAIFFGNITFGSALNFFAPAMEDLRVKFDSTVDSMAIVFTVNLIGYGVGALSSMFIYMKIRRQIGVIIFLGGMAFAMFVTPHLTSQTLFFVVGGVLGFSAGAYDCSQVVWMIEIWQDKAMPFIQTQHFCYAIGANIPPLLMAPFLSKDDDEDDVITSTISSLSRNFTLFADEDFQSTTPEEYSSTLWIPFTVAGILSSTAMSFQIFLFIFYRYYIPPLYVATDDLSIESNNKDTEKDAGKGSNADLSVANFTSTDKLEPGKVKKQGFSWDTVNWDKVKLIVIIGAFLGGYQGMEMCTMQFIPTFGQYSDLKLSESDASFVLTGLTAAFAVGRFIGIFVIMKIPPVPVLFLNLSIVLVGNFVLLFWASGSITWFWVASATLGAGFSTIYASFSCFMENNLIFTNAIGSFMIVCGSTIAAIYPIIVGQGIEDKAVTLTYVNFFSVGVCVIALSLGYLLTRNKKERL